MAANQVPGECPETPLDDKPREACGVFGIYAPGANISSLTYFGLFSLQHRGQESAGIAVSDGETITAVKDLGLVAQVFDERKLSPLQGHIAIGHTRYSTTGATTWENSQPVYRSAGDCGFALAHNGNLTNTQELTERVGLLPGTATSDSDVVAAMIAQHHSGEATDGRALERALVKILPELEGAFTFTLLDDSRLIGVRDPMGFRPLCLGRVEDGWVLASETCALDIIGAHLVREIEPGEMIVIDAQGVRTHKPFDKIEPRMCVFEFVYFARPDSQLYGRSVYRVRHRMGELLAEQSPAVADLVMPVPESGVAAAHGYSQTSGIPYGDGLVKNRYVGRTFIEPTQQMRDHRIRMKLNPLRENIDGRRLVVIDDSIVRGSTTRQLVAILREAGAEEVHVRITSPPYRWPCFFGMDTGRRSELLAADMSVGEICDYIGADSLSYLDLDRMLEATGIPEQGFCTACLSGEYPVPIRGDLRKDILELDDAAEDTDEPASA